MEELVNFSVDGFMRIALELNCNTLAAQVIRLFRTFVKVIHHRLCITGSCI